MSKPGFLARKDLPPVALPVFQNPQPAAQPPSQDNPGVAAFVKGEAESSRLSLEGEIVEFYFEEDIPKAPLIELLDVEGEPDRNFVIGTPPLIITCLDDSSDEEVDNMASNKGKSLRELMAARGKGQTSKAPTKSQTPSNLPPAPPQIPADLSLKANLDLKKKRPVESLKEGEVGPRQGTKQQKVTREHRDKRAPSVESREELDRAEVRMPPRTWSPQLEVEGASIPYNTSVREYKRGLAGYIAAALEQHMLLLRDMKAYRRFSQGELFLSLKRDLAMVRQLIFYRQDHWVILYSNSCHFVILGQITQQVFVVEELCRGNRNLADVEALSRVEVEKALGDLKQEHHELFKKLKEVETGLGVLRLA